MTSICDLFPEDASCSTAPDAETPVQPNQVKQVNQPEDYVDGVVDQIEDDPEEGDKYKIDRALEDLDGEDWSQMSPLATYEQFVWMQKLIQRNNPIWANLAYLTGSFGLFLNGVLNLFRYRNNLTYYESGMLGDKATNWWKLSDQIRLLFMTSIGLIASITQLLAIAGVATYDNLTVWTVLVTYGGFVTACFVVALRMIGYDRAFVKYYDPNSTISHRLFASLAYFYLGEDAYDDWCLIAAVGVLWAWNADSWFWAQWDHMTLEQQQTLLEQYELDMEQNQKRWAQQLAEDEPAVQDAQSEDEIEPALEEVVEELLQGDQEVEEQVEQGQESKE